MYLLGIIVIFKIEIAILLVLIGIGFSYYQMCKDNTELAWILIIMTVISSLGILLYF